MPTSNKTIPDTVQQDIPANGSTADSAFSNIASFEKEKAAILEGLKTPLDECIPEEQVEW